MIARISSRGMICLGIHRAPRRPDNTPTDNIYNGRRRDLLGRNIVWSVALHGARATYRVCKVDTQGSRHWDWKCGRSLARCIPKQIIPLQLMRSCYLGLLNATGIVRSNNTYLSRPSYGTRMQQARSRLTGIRPAIQRMFGKRAPSPALMAELRQSTGCNGPKTGRLLEPRFQKSQREESYCEAVLTATTFAETYSKAVCMVLLLETVDRSCSD